MKKTLFILVGSIAVPSLLLAGLALKKASEQQIVLERETAALYQRTTDELAAEARRRMEKEQRAFVAAVDSLVEEEDPRRLARNFSARLPRRWPRARVGFAVALRGGLLSPRAEPAAPPEWRAFLADNRAFLAGEAPAPIYQVQVRLPNPAQTDTSQSLAKAQRNVAPQQAFGSPELVQQESKLVELSSDFASAVGQGSAGTITRFVQNRIQIFFWHRPERSPDLVFGAMLTPAELRDLWASHLEERRPAISDACLVLLDERAEPVYRSLPGFEANWKLPFVATEIGEALPYWEAALYLTDPSRFTRTARSLTLLLGLLIALSLAAIAWGSVLVVRETRRQMLLVERKADFVSSVSHELKSPLTSIRLFADLLRQNRVPEPEKRAHYLRIMAEEAERLTRLINNVLDFSRLERHPKPAARDAIDLHPVIQKTWEAEAERLRSSGFRTEWEAAPPPYPAAADADAVAQILVNLLSNAEKYSSEKKEIRLRTGIDNGGVYASVLDRGMGVPAGQEEAIFEPFHRAHDSLSSGIGGTGLGLALARSLALSQGGSLCFEPREGGGSAFTLRLPAAERKGVR